MIDSDDAADAFPRSPTFAADERAESDDAADGTFNPAAALAFWCCLIVSAILFAAVALSPKVRAYRELRHEYVAVEGKLAVEERQFRHLQQVADALQNDPEFASELARKDFGTNESEERIAVDPKLSLQDHPETPREAKRGNRPGLLETPLLDELCDSPFLRRSFLGAASLLVLVGFTLLSGGHRLPGESGLGTRCRTWLANRYFQPNLSESRDG